MLFLFFAQANLLDETRLTNNGLYFPFGTEKYIVGGYFSLYLAERFGTRRQPFLLGHAIHYFNLYVLMPPLRRILGSITRT